MEQETEAAVLTLYEHIGITMGSISIVALAVLISYRFGKAFHSYIYTGRFMRLVKSNVIGTLIDECPEDSMEAFFKGTQPFGIIIDAVVFGFITMLMPFIWGGVVPIVLIMVLAYVIRQRIARKQDFVSKLDGTHSNVGGTSEDMTQGPSGQISTGGN